LKKAVSLLLILMLVMSLFVGCGNNAASDANADEKNSAEVTENTSTDENSDSESAEEEVKDNGPRVFRQTGSKVTTLNQQIYETSSESSVMALVYGNLLGMFYDEEKHTYKIIGDHAEGKPTRNEEGTVWTFKIRDGVKWADGTPIDAYTYEESYKILLDPTLANYRANTFFEDITVVNAEEYYKGEVKEWSEVGIKALDKNTLQFTLSFPVPEIDFYLTFAGGGPTSPIKLDLYESCYNEDRSENSYGTSLDKTPSSGPYKLVEWNRDQSRVYEKNMDYPTASYYVPTKIEERVVEDRSARMQLFENGDTDYVSISGSDYDKYGEDPRLVFSTSTTVWSMFINMTSEEKAFLRDVNFRKAMYYAMNREAIAENIYKTARPAGYVVSSAKIADPKTGMKYRDSEAAKAIMPKNNGYDLELAKEYMQKAFDKHGKMVVELSYFDSSDNMKRMAELLEQEYENAFGTDVLDVVLKAVPWQTSYENMENGTYDMAFGGWAGSRFNPWSGMVVYTSDFGSKIDQFKSEEFDALYDRTVKGDLIFKPKERLEALAKMEQMLFDAVPFVPFMEPQTPYLFSERVHLITGGDYIPGVGFAELQSELDPLQ